MAIWVPDILGTGFECTTFDLGPDEDAQADEDDVAERGAQHPGLAATLVRALPKPLTSWQRLTGKVRPFEDVDVLYVHGWSDYFFQKNLAAFWTNRGARFFALDLRRYGRSFREGQTPGYITDLADYDQEIDLAIDEIGGGTPRKSKRKLVLLGHSTGGLVFSLWCARNPGVADALLLNSPWLEFQLASRVRQIITPIVRLGARYNPLDTAPLLDHGFYSRAQGEVGPKAELDGLNLTWRPAQVRTVHTGWLNAILAGHEQVHRGLGLEIPICVLLSARSVLPTKWSDDLTRADTVLDVDEVAKAALQLGASVTIERIDGALHDIFLSADAPRREAYERLERWMLGLSGAAARVGR
ncbi:MAG: alpha/beta hydrolase [Leucobacter sp.]